MPTKFDAQVCHLPEEELCTKDHQAGGVSSQSPKKGFQNSFFCCVEMVQTLKLSKEKGGSAIPVVFFQMNWQILGEVDMLFSSPRSLHLITTSNTLCLAVMVDLENQQ